MDEHVLLPTARGSPLERRFLLEDSSTEDSIRESTAPSDNHILNIPRRLGDYLRGKGCESDIMQWCNKGIQRGASIGIGKYKEYQ